MKTRPRRGPRRKGGTIALNWGRWGGLYFRRGYTTRLCVGPLAVTYFPQDLDEMLVDLLALGRIQGEFYAEAREREAE